VYNFMIRISYSWRVGVWCR